MNLPLIFASLMGGCCPSYEPDEYRLGYDQEALDALRDKLTYVPPAPSGLTGGTGTSTAGPVPPTTTTLAPARPEDFSCEELCDSGDYVSDCGYADLEDDEVVAVDCVTVRECVGGRRHAVVQPRPAVATTDPIGAELARMAHDEWASVHAFEALAQELRASRAPSELVHRVLEAAVDEVRHAHAVAAAATLRGAIVPVPSLRPLPPRSREAIATENAVEAVVFETWAALRAWHQGRHAHPSLRALFARIAHDETRHATLAADLHGWLLEGLDRDARDRVLAARDEAVERLLAAGVAPHDDARRALGLPDRAERERLLLGLRATYWS